MRAANGHAILCINNNGMYLSSDKTWARAYRLLRRRGHVVAINIIAFVTIAKFKLGIKIVTISVSCLYVNSAGHVTINRLSDLNFAGCLVSYFMCG